MIRDTRYRVRFHLGKGPHFGHWQVTKFCCDGRKTVEYYDPKTTRMWLFGARLCNQQATARKIHAGAHKKVCAWIQARHVAISEQSSFDNFQPHRFQAIRFNPKIQPNWIDGQGSNLDGKRFDRLFTLHTGVYADGV